MGLMLTVTEQPVLLEWARRRAGATSWGPRAEAMGAVDAETGRIVAVMVISGYLDDAAVIHFASDGRKSWATPSIIKGMLGYLFVFKGLNRVVGFTPADNPSMLRLILGLGFQIEGRVRRSPDGAEQDIMTSMFASECAWIKDKEPDHG